MPVRKVRKVTKATKAKVAKSKAPRPAAARPRRSAIPPHQASPPDRRKAILESAELLFSERGYHAVSVRDIARHAGVQIALVAYYYGRKDELLDTIFSHRRAFVEERLARVKAASGASDAAALETIVRAWAEPAVRLRASPSGAAFSRLVALAAWDQTDVMQAVSIRHYDELATAFIEAVARVLPKLGRLRVVQAYSFALGALVMQIGDGRVERLSGGRLAAGDPAALDDLVDFIVGGFRNLGMLDADG
jgi:AcrR family transcriptional regulator